MIKIKLVSFDYNHISQYFDVFPGLVVQAAGEFEEGYVDMVLWIDAQCEELQL